MDLEWSSAPWINWLLFSSRLYLWGFGEVTQVFSAIWIFLNFWNRFELLEYLLVNFIDLLLIIFLDFLGFNMSAFSSLTNLVLLHRPITSSWLVVAIHVACFAILFFFHICLLTRPILLLIRIAQTLRPALRKSVFLLKTIRSLLHWHLLRLAAIETNHFISLFLIRFLLDFFVRIKLLEIGCFFVRSYWKSAFLIQFVLAHKPWVDICNFFGKAFVCRLVWIFLFFFFFVIHAIRDSLEHVWVIWYVLDQMVRIPVD